jgi:glucan 1,3-beta-glucosidase
MGFSTLITAILAFQFFGLGVFGAPAPVPVPQDSYQTAASGYWLETIERLGKPAFGAADFQIFRNVKDFGAVGDGATDDTDAIMSAITTGNRCGKGCDSTTVTPAIIYFPAGTYKVSKPLQLYYYTQVIGDAVNMPTILAAPEFEGMAVLDADPYDDSGNNWFTNQNNFFRQIRNLVIDLRQMPMDRGAGIHWQVAQATSLQNIRFEMVVDSSENNKQLGIFMDNGSGGFMTDLTFNGGQYGAFFGSQQFTTRNLTFNDCRTAIFMNWNWAWSLHGVSINNCGVGVDMSNGGEAQTVGSVMLLDSTIANTPIGVATAYDPNSAFTNGSLIIENTDMSQNVPTAIANTINPDAPSTILAGNQVVASFVQGRVYDASGAGKAVQAADTAPTKPAVLLDADGKVFTRAKPQYESVPESSFVHVKKNGAVGDGATDDSDAIQAIFDAATADQVVYFDHGAYIITKTIEVPKDIRITGEFWPLIMAGGDSTFKDENNPQPMFRVGKAGDVGNVEITELMFETQGAQPGAIIMEWNVEAETPGSAGIWDSHFRIGGSAGTQLQSDKCSKTPDQTTTANPECIGAFLLLHITASGSAYLENTWFWVSDHELDMSDHNQINIYNGRGVLIESTKPTWLWGTSSEHSVLYNYQISNAQNVYLSMIQTETAYMQGNPDARTPFAIQEKYGDPNWDTLCADGSDNCARTVGFRSSNSSDVFLYGGGLYSFFDNYNQDCLATADCQQDMIYVDGGSNVQLVGISTKAAVNMLRLNDNAIAVDADNRNNFCAMVAKFQTA